MNEPKPVHPTPPAYPHWEQAPLNDGHLLRAAQYRVDPVDGSCVVFRVIGGGKWHYVNLGDPGDGQLCDCEQFCATEQLCQHAHAAMLYMGVRRVAARFWVLVHQAFKENRLVLRVTDHPHRQP